MDVLEVKVCTGESTLLLVIKNIGFCINSAYCSKSSDTRHSVVANLCGVVHREM